MEEKDWKREERDMIVKEVLCQATDTQLGREEDPPALQGIQETLYW